MRIILIIFGFILAFTQLARGNNIQVSNVRLTGQNTTDDFTMVEFDISWENSWRYANGPGNWDAAWIFIKYRIAGSPWSHAWLNNSGHVSCAGTTIENGLLTPGSAFNAVTNPALGVFLYRSVPGVGNISCSDVQLRWNYGAGGVTDNAQIDIEVFAIEMCYVPQGNYYVGSGGAEPGAFFTYPSANVPYLITSESAITIGTSSGNLFYNNPMNSSGDQAGPVPAAFPKAYAPFYAMKYEISQKGYVDFLNTLKRNQQSNRVRSNIATSNVANEYVMATATVPSQRNGIACLNTIPPAPANVEFFCDLNGNGIPNENADGLGVPCNYLTYEDLTSYLDWAALRPWTEFEFEKCGRGSINPIPNEFAWGTLVIYLHSGIVNSGQPAEVPGDLFSNATGYGGPLRNGAFARATTNREKSGSGYYGIMDLSGNLFERGVTIGSNFSRSYTGGHGNGLLSENGNADVVNWPISPNQHCLFTRGGSWADSSIEDKRLSDRTYASQNLIDFTNEAIGGRGVRTAP